MRSVLRNRLGRDAQIGFADDALIGFQGRLHLVLHHVALIGQQRDNGAGGGLSGAAAVQGGQFEGLTDGIFVLGKAPETRMRAAANGVRPAQECLESGEIDGAGATVAALFDFERNLLPSFRLDMPARSTAEM